MQGQEQGGTLPLVAKATKLAHNNGPVAATARAMGHAMAQAAGAGVAALLVGARGLPPLRTTLAALGHPQPATPPAGQATHVPLAAPQHPWALLQFLPLLPTPLHF